MIVLLCPFKINYGITLILLIFMVYRLMMGDFNYILNTCDKRGGGRFHIFGSVVYFQIFIKSAYLNDLDFLGTCFTWCNNKYDIAHI